MRCKECDEIKYTLSKNSFEQSYCIPKDNSSSLYLYNQLKWYITGYNSTEHYKIYDYEIFNDVIYENYDYTLTYKCPEDKPYIIYSTRQCVSTCLNYYDLFEYGLFFTNKSLYLYNNICYDECPMGSISDNNTMTCIEINKYSFENLIVKDEFEKNYQQNVDIYLAKSANNTIFQIISTEFTNFFYNSSTNDSWKYEQNMPLFYFDECISLLMEEYNLSKNEIHVGIFQNNDLKKSNQNFVPLYAINSTSYKLFLSNGTNLNISICTNLQLKVKKPINTSLIWNFKESLEIFEKYNLSIFDGKNKMFEDMCIPLELNGKDISIFTRQNRIKSKLKLCDKGCDFIGVDYEKNYSICHCKFDNKEEDSSMDIKDFLNQNFEIINQTTKSNIRIFKCITKTKFDRRNYIFYISLVLFIFNNISLILFFLFYLKKTKLKNANINEKKEFNNNTENEKSHKNSVKNIISVISNKQINSNSSDDNKNNTFIYNLRNDNNKNLKNDILKLNVNSFSKKRDNILTKSVPIEISKKYNIYDNDTTFENNKINNFYSKFKNNVIENFYEIFPFKNNFNKISLLILIKIIIFLFQSFLFWTGLLNTEEYITKRFDEKNKIGILYILTNEFNKYFITSIIAFASLKILKYLYYEINFIKPKDSENKRKNNPFCKTKCFIIFIEVIIVLLHTFYMIFLYIFGNIYPNNKNLLLISTTISLTFIIIVDIFIIILSSFLKSIPFICNCMNDSEFIFKEIGDYLLKII